MSKDLLAAGKKSLLNWKKHLGEPGLDGMECLKVWLPSCSQKAVIMWNINVKVAQVSMAECCHISEMGNLWLMKQLQKAEESSSSKE